MQYFLTNGARQLQMAIQLSIIWLWVAILAVGTTGSHPSIEANVTLHGAKSCISSPEGDRRARSEFKREGIQAGEVLGQRNR